jgi:hypothetical protein
MSLAPADADASGQGLASHKAFAAGELLGEKEWSDQFDSILTEIESEYSERVPDKSDTEATLKDPAETPAEKQLQQAIESSRLDPRSALGQLFVAETKKHEHLRDGYSKAVGRAAKEAFRLSWADRRWQTVCEAKIETTQQVSEEFENSVYEPLRVVFQKEGGDMEAITATKNILAKATSLGFPYIRKSPWSQRLEVLYVKGGYNTSFSRINQTVLTSHAVAKPKIAKVEPQDPAAPPDTPIAKKQRTSDMPDVTPDSLPKPPDSDKKAAMRLHQELGKKKQVCINTLNSGQSLLQILNSTDDPSWAWAQNDQNKGGLKKLVDEVVQCRDSTDFVAKWLMLTTMELRSEESSAKCQLSNETIVPVFMKLVQNLESKIVQLKKMKAAATP